MSETWTLDPDGVALTIHGGTVSYPRWEHDGLTFTPGVRKAVRIEPTSTDGEVVSHGARSNAQISGRLILSETSGWADRSQAIADIQAIEEDVATEGVVLKREFPDATSISYDVVGMEVDWEFLHRHERLPVSFEVFRGLGYGAEVTASSVTSGTTTPLARGTITHVGGAAQARGHALIEDLQSQHHLWALSFARYAGSASTDQLYYEAEALTPGGNAAGTAFANAYGGTVVAHPTPARTDWDLLVDSGTLTHQEPLNVWARATNTAPTVWNGNAEYRLSYRLGSGGWTTLEPQRTSKGFPFQWLDLGHVSLDGSDWQFRIFTRQPDAPGSSAGVDCVVLAPSRYSVEVGGDIIGSDMIEAAHSARDGFGFTGNLDARTPTIGAAWATGGASTDFTGTSTTTETVQRAATSDAQARRGRFGPDMTACAARVDVMLNASAVFHTVALGLRMTSVSSDSDALLIGFANNWFNAGPASEFGAAGSDPFIHQPNTWYTLFGAVVGSSFLARLIHRGAVIIERRGFSTGIPASGKVGIRDINIGGGSVTRFFRRPVAWVPNVNPAMSANESLEIAFDEAVRIDSGVDTPKAVSAGLWLPESGREQKPVEWGVLTSRGNPRLGTGDLTGVNKRVTVSHTPQWPVAPEDPS